jgi:hypothetical protein
MTRPEYAPYLERYDSVPQQTRLSNPALEVLAVIAYRQPIGRNEVEEIRGVGSSGVLKTLQDRSLIDVVGRSEGLGRPLLYGTTNKFLDHFGFNSLEDLPRPDDLPVILRPRPVDYTPIEKTADLEADVAADAPPTPEEAIKEIVAGEERRAQTGEDETPAEAAEDDVERADNDSPAEISG